jgi:hypothetical protein
MQHEPSSPDSSLDLMKTNQSALAPMQVSNLEHLFLCTRAIIMLETSTSVSLFQVL